MILRLCLLLTFALISKGAWAEEFHPLYRSTRAQGMGGASIAVVDPMEAGFLNPAALSGNNDVSWSYLNLDLEGSSDFYSA